MTTHEALVQLASGGLLLAPVILVAAFLPYERLTSRAPPRWLLEPSWSIVRTNFRWTALLLTLTIIGLYAAAAAQ